MSDGWTTIESDPGVFFQLIREFGVKGVQVDELWSLDSQTLASIKPVYGLIFLFKWVADKDLRPVDNNSVGNVFFAKQVITNACATQAILSVLMNSRSLDLGQELTQFRDFTADFPPDMKGLAISNSESIRQAHNSFARPEPIVPDEREASKDDDAFHFISYVHVNGTLYELDGLKDGPIPLASCSEDEWLEKVVPEIQSRMAKYAEKEVRFNIMAVVGDRLEAAERKAAELQALKKLAEEERLHNNSTSSTSADSNQAACTLLPGGDDEELSNKIMSLDAELAVIGAEVKEERDKRARWANENIRRRHNYVPFLFNMLRLIAEKGQMDKLIERARAQKKQKLAGDGQ
ncbi:hypothetical protein CEUSTIGMA_g8445.t1 [Chlamydomonas eustigma]|uniref:Ubiquitin carboxyl-terminal hydrolase n=1 Tax=Chlamydomonas eustigma TaxID=1157962 RepID=A0A250XE08_9CHLO|nr:hypothetical protein CEUSTIGMA_g8445.t1 [Chlamydomonas eustigma]|eukprot:GAX81010.1 hypothetical protein CEUSTIGMA_g8445.t1 [Chlamydomonas eustigma]